MVKPLICLADTNTYAAGGSAKHEKRTTASPNQILPDGFIARWSDSLSFSLHSKLPVPFQPENFIDLRSSGYSGMSW